MSLAFQGFQIDQWADIPLDIQRQEKITNVTSSMLNKQEDQVQLDLEGCNPCGPDEDLQVIKMEGIRSKDIDDDPKDNQLFEGYEVKDRIDDANQQVDIPQETLQMERIKTAYNSEENISQRQTDININKQNSDEAIQRAKESIHISRYDDAVPFTCQVADEKSPIYSTPPNDQKEPIVVETKPRFYNSRLEIQENTCIELNNETNTLCALLQSFISLCDRSNLTRRITLKCSDNSFPLEFIVEKLKEHYSSDLQVMNQQQNKEVTLQLNEQLTQNQETGYQFIMRVCSSLFKISDDQIESKWKGSTYTRGGINKERYSRDGRGERGNRVIGAADWVEQEKGEKGYRGGRGSFRARGRGNFRRDYNASDGRSFERGIDRSNQRICYQRHEDERIEDISQGSNSRSQTNQTQTVAPLRDYKNRPDPSSFVNQEKGRFETSQATSRPDVPQQSKYNQTYQRIDKQLRLPDGQQGRKLEPLKPLAEKINNPEYLRVEPQQYADYQQYTKPIATQQQLDFYEPTYDPTYAFQYQQNPYAIQDVQPYLQQQFQYSYDPLMDQNNFYQPYQAPIYNQQPYQQPNYNQPLYQQPNQQVPMYQQPNHQIYPQQYHQNQLLPQLQDLSVQIQPVQRLDQQPQAHDRLYEQPQVLNNEGRQANQHNRTNGRDWVIPQQGKEETRVGLNGHRGNISERYRDEVGRQNYDTLTQQNESYSLQETINSQGTDTGNSKRQTMREKMMKYQNLQEDQKQNEELQQSRESNYYPQTGQIRPAQRRYQ